MPTRLVCLVLLVLAASGGDARAEVRCPLDPALSNAAAELLLVGQAPDGAQLTAAVRAAESDAVGLRALYLPQNDPAKEQAWLQELAAKSDAPLVCGEARTARARLLIASPRAATLYVSHGTVRASLAPDFTRPELVIRASGGEVQRLSVTPDELARGVPLDPEWRAAQVQLVARNASGPRPVAERSLGSGVEPLALSAEALDANGVADVIAQLRGRHRRAALRRNRLADRVAIGHARAVCAEGRVVHALEPGVDPQTRVARAGLEARLVGETVARARDPGAALTSLWHSPSHALTLLEPRFTDLGVGLAEDAQKRTCLVVLLLAWPRAVPRAPAQ